MSLNQRPVPQFPFWQSISFRFLMICMLLIIGPVLSLGYLAFRESVRAVDTLSTRAALREIEPMQEATDSYFTHLDAITKAIYRRNPVRSVQSPYDYLSDSYPIYPATTPPEEDLQTKVMNYYLDGLIRLDPAIDNAFIVNKNGKVFWAENSLYRSRMWTDYNFMNQAWFRKIKQKFFAQLLIWGPGEVSTAYLQYKNRNTLTCARNIYDIGNQGLPYLATLFLNVDVQSMIGSWGRFNSQNLQKIYVVTTQGKLAFGPDEQLIGANWNQFKVLKNKFSGKKGQFLSRQKNQQQMITYVKSNVTNWWFVGIADYNALTAQAQRIRNDTYLVLALFLALALLAAWVSHNSFTQPVRQILQAMRHIEQGDFGANIPCQAPGELGKIGMRLNKMTERLEEYINRAYVAELHERAAQLEALHSQINPHFLYNVLESVRMNLLESREEATAEVIRNLARFIRGHVHWGDGITTFNKELQLVQDYMDIQSYRFPGRIRLETAIPNQYLSACLPKLAVLTLIENAVVHGLEPKRQGGLVRLSAAPAPSGLAVTVFDNGVGMAPERLQELQASLVKIPDIKPESQIGLRNVAQRLRLAFGPEYELQIRSELNYGTEIRLTLPWEGDSDAESKDIDC